MDSVFAVGAKFLCAGIFPLLFAYTNSIMIELFSIIASVDIIISSNK